MTTKLQRLQDLHPDIVTDFLETYKSAAIPIEMQNFIMQLQWAIEIREVEHERSITRAAAKLRVRVFAAQKIKMSIPNCKIRIAQAMNYFSVDLNVPQKVWDLDTADKLEDLKKLAIKNNDFKTAHRIEKDINEYRRRASQVLSDEDFQPHVFLMDPKITGGDLGFEEKNLKEIAAKHNDGFYVELITKLPLEDDEKKQLFNDADIVDTDYEEVNDE